MPTPAEQLAASKPRRHRAAPQTVRRKVWRCRIREKREELGLSMREVAQACGITVSALWEIEGGADLRLTTARRLTEFFGMTSQELWETIPEEKSC